MKKLANILKVGGVAVALVLTTVNSHAQAIPGVDVSISLDEMGNGNLWGAEALFGISPVPMAGVIRNEPISGQSALRYTLPLGTLPVTSGDVFLYHPGAVFGVDQPSDLIRFAANRIWFFSDLDDVPAQLADVGVPAANPNTRVINLYEQGTEGGLQGYQYIVDMTDPTSPGWSPDIDNYAVGQGAPPLSGAVSFGYNFISNVPEPSSLALLGLAGGLALLRKRR